MQIQRELLNISFFFMIQLKPIEYSNTKLWEGIKCGYITFSYLELMVSLMW